MDEFKGSLGQSDDSPKSYASLTKEQEEKLTGIGITVRANLDAVEIEPNLFALAAYSMVLTDQLEHPVLTPHQSIEKRKQTLPQSERLREEERFSLPTKKEAKNPENQAKLISGLNSDFRTHIDQSWLDAFIEAGKTLNKENRERKSPAEAEKEQILIED